MNDRPYPVYVIDDVTKMAEEHDRFRRALLWVFDRLGVDGGMSETEQRRTREEIASALLGQPSIASDYTPNDRDESAKRPD